MAIDHRKNNRMIAGRNNGRNAHEELDKMANDWLGKKLNKEAFAEEMKRKRFWDKVAKRDKKKRKPKSKPEIGPLLKGETR